MNVGIRRGWIEYLTGGSNAGFFAPVIHDAAELIVPSISVYEVCRVLLRIYDVVEALDMLSSMFRGRIVPLDAEIADAGGG